MPVAGRPRPPPPLPLLRTLLLVLAAPAPVLPSAAAAADRLNVLVLLVDDLRPTLGCYGDSLAVTPSMDALAGQSALFAAAYAQQALCGPSRTSLLTSRRPQTIRLFDVHSYWRETAGNFTSLPQLFRQSGYHTASMGKVFHPGIVSNHSDDQPYSWSEAPYHPPAQRFKDWPVCLGADGELHSNLFCPVDPSAQPLGTLSDIQTAERATRWLQDRGDRGAPAEPWLLAVGLHKPHIPLKMPMEYLDLYPADSVPAPVHPRRPEDLPAVAWNPWTDLRRRDDVSQLNVSFPYGPMPEFFARTVRQGYYAATSYADDLLGRVLAALVSSGQAGSTLVLLAGDHGWALGERGEWAKYSTSEDATRTPLLLHVPGVTGSLDGFRHVSPLERRGEGRARLKAAVVVTQPVELLDVMPTLAEAALNRTLPRCPSAGRQPDLCTEGRSLMPLVRRPTDAAGQQPLRQDLQHLRWSAEPTEEWTSQRRDVFHRSASHSAAIAAQWEDRLRTNRLPRARLTSPTVLSSSRRSPLSPAPGPCTPVPPPPPLPAAFSQYPRPSVLPQINSDQPQLRDIRVMGYSVRAGSLRFTEWVEYDPVALLPHWSRLLARELYDHRSDPLEARNVAEEPACRALVEAMSRLLRTQGAGGGQGGDERL